MFARVNVCLWKGGCALSFPLLFFMGLLSWPCPPPPAVGEHNGQILAHFIKGCLQHSGAPFLESTGGGSFLLAQDKVTVTRTDLLFEPAVQGRGSQTSTPWVANACFACLACLGLSVAFSSRPPGCRQPVRLVFLLWVFDRGLMRSRQSKHFTLQHLPSCDGEQRALLAR